MTDNRYDSTRAAWEQIWQQADVAAELEIVRSKRSLAAMRLYTPYLPQDDLILEAGSGLGAVIITLRRRGYKVVGLDYATNALHATHQYDGDLRLLAGDIHDLPFADATLGAYLSFGVLEHFEHGLLPGLREAQRVLKPDGVLVLTIPYPNVIYRLVQAKRMMTGEGQLTDEDFYESAYSRAALTDNVEAAGFRVLKAEPLSHAFTLWGLGGPFRGQGYYQTSAAAEATGDVLREVLPWAFNFMTLVVARKV